MCVLEDKETVMVQICRWYPERMMLCTHGYQTLVRRTAALGVAGGVGVEVDIDCWVLRAQNIARLRQCCSRFWMDRLQARIRDVGELSYRQGANRRLDTSSRQTRMAQHMYLLFWPSPGDR
jgi:hypothetical protein